MTEPAFTMTQAAALTDCSVHQLRYWDETALVRPSIQGTNGHQGVRRLYSEKDLERARAIKKQLDAGYTLQGIRRLEERGVA